MFIAAADDLEEEIGGVRIVGEVANLVDGEQGGAGVVAEPAFEGAGGLLAIEIEQQVRRGDKARAVAGQDDLMDDVLGEHRLAEALGTDQEDVLGAVEEVEGEDPFERGPVERGRPVPVPVGDRCEATETGGTIGNIRGGRKLTEAEMRAILDAPGISSFSSSRDTDVHVSFNAKNALKSIRPEEDLA